VSVPIQRFSASWSAMTWLVTLAILFAAVIATGVVLTKAERIAPENESASMRLTVLALVVPVILMLAVVFAPLGYTVDGSGIVVNRMGPKICIRHSEVAEIRPIRRCDVGFGIRLNAFAGFFGFYGRFTSTRLGRFHAYVTDFKRLVLITRTDGTKLLLSPFPTDVFIEAVEKARS
jgi:Bacterial PH domain